MKAGRVSALFFAPFVSSTMRIEPMWIDYNGHLNMAYYHVLFDRAVDEAMSLVGLGQAYIQERNLSFFSVEAHVLYKRELRLEDPVRVRVYLIAYDDKRLHLFQEMCHATEGWVAASCELMALHVDLATRKVAPFPADIEENLSTMQGAHSVLPKPEGLGRAIRMPERKRTH